MAVYDLHLRAQAATYSDSPEGYALAVALLDKALALEPENARVLASAAMASMLVNVSDGAPISAEVRTRCAALARRGLQNAGGDATVMAQCALALVHTAREYDLGMAAIRAAVEANPNDMIVVACAGILNLHWGDLQAALGSFHRAIQLNPRDPGAAWILTGVAHVQMVLGDFTEALAWATRSRALSPDYACNLWMLVAANAHLGRTAEARRFLAELRKVSPGVTVSRIWAGQPQKDPNRTANILDGLRLAGLAEGPEPEPTIPSLAVLPFENMSGDPEQEYFADGIADDIITALSRFKSFAVIARNSSFTYKGRAVEVRQVAKDLGVRYVLEGSVRRAGARLRITAQLVDGGTGAHLWARNFDGALDEVFDFQDRITENVVRPALKAPRGIAREPHIQLAEIERSRRERPRSIATYDFYLRAVAKLSTDTAQGNADAYALLMEAIRIELDNALFLANANYALFVRIMRSWPTIGPDDKAKRVELAHRALLHAAGDATVLALCGIALVHVGKDYDGGMAMLRSAVEANPNNLQVVHEAGVVNLHCGKLEDALGYFHRAIRLSPRDPRAHFSLTGIAHVQMILGNFNEALVWASRALTLQPNYHPTYWMLIAGNAHLGRMGEARRFLDQFKMIAPGTTIASIWAGQPQKDPNRTANILDGLRLAGLIEGPEPEPTIPSLAVLPFQNMSSDPEQDYFADGIADDIITALSRFKSFAVIARNSSFTYKGRAVDVRQVAKDLGVRYVLEGSVRRAGAKLRIAAQLVDGATGANLWAKSFDGALDDVFEFQDLITASAATVTEPYVQAAEIERSRMQRPGSIAAYDLYLRALSKHRTSNPEDNVAAYALFTEALRLEPENGVFLAYAAAALDHRITMGAAPIGANDWDKREELARRGLEHAGNDATVMGNCGAALMNGRDYDLALATVQRAVETNPNNLYVFDVRRGGEPSLRQH